MKSTRWLFVTILAAGLGLAIGSAKLPLCVGAFTPTKTPASPDGVRAICDLPAAQHMENTVGSDGLGLCVFTALEVSARWQNVRELDGFQEWMTHRPGGGYPEKLDEMLKKFCKDKGRAVPRYVQHTGGDLAFLELAMKTRRMPAVTYSGRDGFYLTRVAHMVDLAHLDATRAAIIDNNRPGVWVWMSRSEFATRWREMDGGWAVVLLAPPPPPGPPIVGDCRCPDCRCPDCPEPIGNPPSADHEWGIIPGHGWGWRLKAIRPNFGIELRKDDGKPHYWINGAECSRDEAISAIAADGLADDADRHHLSIVAADRTDFDLALYASQDLRRLADKCHVQIYSPDSWVAKSRLSAPVTLNAPAARGGAVIGTAATITAEDLLALLRPTLDPDWRPEPVPAPAPHVPTPDPQPGPMPCPPCPGPLPCPPSGPQPDLWVTLLAAALVLFSKKRS